MTNEKDNSVADATKLNLADWNQWAAGLDVDSLFVTISGAHIYGFASRDSDVDLRGAHRLPLESILGLSAPKETVDFSALHKGLEVDLVSHDVGKYLGLLVKNNGYILEQVFSPLVVSGHEFLDELRPIARNCITKNHFYHYRGFFATQKKLIGKQEPVTAKAVLYAYRVLCTGIHLMRTGKVVTDLNQLAGNMGLSFIEELIAAKVTEKVAFGFDVKEHLSRLDGLEKELESAFEASSLPDRPDRGPVNDLLIRVRLADAESAK